MKNGPKVTYNTENTTEVGFLLGTTRIARGLTQTQLAAAAGMSQNHLANIEQGRRTLTARYVRVVSALLGLNPVEVAGLAIQENNSFKRMKKVVNA
jgi:transcriptional regulator with XRE-family HTH domain